VVFHRGEELMKNENLKNLQGMVLGGGNNNGGGVSAYCDPQQASVQVGFTKNIFKNFFPNTVSFLLYFYKNSEGLSNEPVTVTD
jgi:hypothetical protein